MPCTLVAYVLVHQSMMTQMTNHLRSGLHPTQVLPHLGLSQGQLDLFTEDQSAAGVIIYELQPAVAWSFKKLVELKDVARCEHVLAIRPTGVGLHRSFFCAWMAPCTLTLVSLTFGLALSHDATLLDGTCARAGRGYTGGNFIATRYPDKGITTVKLPYTSHSTPSLLRQCVAALRPKRIIPTAHVTADMANRHVLKLRWHAGPRSDEMSLQARMLLNAQRAQVPILSIGDHSMHAETAQRVSQRGLAGQVLQRRHPAGHRPIKDHLILQGQAHIRQGLGYGRNGRRR